MLSHQSLGWLIQKFPIPLSPAWPSRLWWQPFVHPPLPLPNVLLDLRSVNPRHFGCLCGYRAEQFTSISIFFYPLISFICWIFFLNSLCSLKSSPFMQQESRPPSQCFRIVLISSCTHSINTEMLPALFPCVQALLASPFSVEVLGAVLIFLFALK